MAHQVRGVHLEQIHPLDRERETDVDIIAIHGLDTKSPDTWIYQFKDGPGKHGVNWLADSPMLPSKVGSARIFTCDWSSALLQSSNLIPKEVDEFARLLLAGLRSRPSPKDPKTGRDRPILFIASCLGGIILVRALLIANRAGSEYLPLRRATRGIIFLATPFRGTALQDVAGWAVPALKALASCRGQEVMINLLQTLMMPNFDLEELVRGFTQLCLDDHHPCKVSTFYELGKTNLGHKVPGLSLFVQSKPVGHTYHATKTLMVFLLGRKTDQS
jgi:hypothetical protein